MEFENPQMLRARAQSTLEKTLSKTDSEIFGPDEQTRTRTKGRPKVNVNLARRLFQAKKYTTGQIAKQLKCHPETIRRIRRQLESEGTLEAEKDIRTKNFIEADFDAECINAMGVSFLEWLSTKRKKPRRVFSFCRRTWDQIWEKPSLVRVRDTRDNLGQQLCIKFLNVFKNDDRSRDRKKLIRQLFIFLGRHDLCDQYLTMTQARDPRAVKKIPEINSPGFPLKLEQAIYEIGLHDPMFPVLIRFKMVTGMRTGYTKEERGIMGLHKGSKSKSYIYIDDEGNFQINVLEKMGEQWSISWMPKRVRDEIEDLYKTIKRDDPLFKISRRELQKFRTKWGDITEEIIGVRLDLHALRKVFLTWLWVLDVRLEIATRINVGWKDLSTADRHYIVIGAHLQRTAREEYAKNIPEWFKDGLDEYISGDARKIAQMINDMAPSILS